MVTTTIRLDDDLKSRITAAAQRAGKSAHAFIVDAVAETVAADEQDAAMNDLADARWNQVVATGEAVSWDDTRTWLQSRLRGETPARPEGRKITG